MDLGPQFTSDFAALENKKAQQGPPGPQLLLATCQRPCPCLLETGMYWALEKSLSLRDDKGKGSSHWTILKPGGSPRPCCPLSRCCLPFVAALLDFGIPQKDTVHPSDRNQTPPHTK